MNNYADIAHGIKQLWRVCCWRIVGILPGILCISCTSPYRNAVTDTPSPSIDSGYAAFFRSGSTTQAVTGNSSFQLGYQFRKGEQLQMRKTFDQNSTSSGSFIRVTEATVDVENVDSAGNAQLVITVTDEKLIPRHAAPQHEKVKSYFEGSIPKMRVTLNPYGKVLSGEILEDSENRKQFKEEMKKPGFKGYMISDEQLAEQNAQSWFWPVSPRSSVSSGEHWNDTTITQKHRHTIQLSNNTSKQQVPSRQQPENLGTNSDYEVVGSIQTYQILPDIQQNQMTYHRVQRSDSLWQELGGGRYYIVTGSTEMLRSSDGLPVWCRKQSSGQSYGNSTFVETVETLDTR